MQRTNCKLQADFPLLQGLVPQSPHCSKVNHIRAVMTEKYSYSKTVLHSICPQIWKTQQWPQDWKSCFHPNLKEGHCQGMFKLQHNCTHFTCQLSKSQNLSSQLQQDVNQEVPYVLTKFREGRGTRDQIANCHWIIEKAREFQKTICFNANSKVSDSVDHNKLQKILKVMGIPDHLTCILQKLYVGQEAKFRTRQ